MRNKILRIISEVSEFASNVATIILIATFCKYIYDVTTQRCSYIFIDTLPMTIASLFIIYINLAFKFNFKSDIEEEKKDD